jgi:hypothetical protein
MTQSVIAQHMQKVAISAVKDIEVTAVVDDGAGGWIRSVRFHGTPAQGSGKALVLEVLLQSAEKADLAITTPAIDF